MKKLLLIAFASALVFGMSACDSKDEPVTIIGAWRSASDEFVYLKDGKVVDKGTMWYGTNGTMIVCIVKPDGTWAEAREGASGLDVVMETSNGGEWENTEDGLRLWYLLSDDDDEEEEDGGGESSGQIRSAAFWRVQELTQDRLVMTIAVHGVDLGGSAESTDPDDMLDPTEPDEPVDSSVYDFFTRRTFKRS